MKSLRARLLIALLLFAGFVYGLDWLGLRILIWRGGGFGSVTVTPEYVIHEKNGKIQYQFADPQAETCVHSLFPHLDYQPCWYLSRHTEQHIEI